MKFSDRISLPLLCTLVILFLLHSPANADSPYQVCGSSSTIFTPNSTYNTNLKLLFTSLTITATNSTTKFGYASGMIGSVPNQISGVVLCRGDANYSTCSSCLTQATHKIQKLCGHNKEATIYDDYCLLRYSYQHFLTTTDQSSSQLLVKSTEKITGISITRFDNLMMNLLNSISIYASNNSSIKFGTGIMKNSSDSPVIYGLAQCMPDLSDSGCLSCLQDQIKLFPQYFSGSQGARVHGWRCNIRYEIYPFYNGVSMLKLTPPPEGITPVTAPALSLSPPLINTTTGETKTKQANHNHHRSMAGETKNTKHILLIHNACHGAWIWYKVKTTLESNGYKVTAPDLAASGRDPRPIQQVFSFADYSKPVLDILHDLPEGEKVILVGHTVGGVTTALAMETYPEKIAAAVFVNAFMPDTTHPPSYVIDKYTNAQTNESWMDVQFSSYPAGELVIGYMILGPQFLKARLYQLTSPEDYTLGLSLCRPGTFFQEDLRNQKPFSKERYGSVDIIYISCSEDLAVPVEHQKWMIENNPVKEVKIIDNADHMVMLSAPKKLSKTLMEIFDGYP